MIFLRGLLEAVLLEAEELFEEKNGQYENEESQDYPNAARVEKLETQVGILEMVKDFIQEAIDGLDEYEF